MAAGFDILRFGWVAGAASPHGVHPAEAYSSVA